MVDKGPSLEEMQGNQATVVVEVGLEKPVRVVYRPYALDQKTWLRIRQNPTESIMDASLRRDWISNEAPAFVLEVVAQWDLRRRANDPTPIPITSEELATVPTPVLQKIQNRIMAEPLPNLTSSELSANGSPPTEP